MVLLLRCGVVPALIGLAGCAVPAPAPPPPAAASNGVPRGIVLAVHPVQWRADSVRMIAAAVGERAVAAPDVPHAREVIVRRPDGRIVSVIVNDARTLRPGMALGAGDAIVAPPSPTHG